jgi:glucose/arabinose dehydrogenase
MAMRRWTGIAIAAAVVLAACGGEDAGSMGNGPPAPTGSTGSRTATTAPSAGGGAAQSVSPKTIATGLDVPWGIAFLPNRDALVSERASGRIVRIPLGGGAPRVVMRVPGVDTSGTSEGGLLGLAVSPTYARDHWVYAYFTTPSDNRIVRFHLGGSVHPILTGLRRGDIHNGGRIAFGPDGKLYAGVGESGDSALAQDRSALNGKILRMNPDGSVPAGNPFGQSLVWSYGHRNVQGLAWDSAGRLWATEFGQNRFDEVNLIRPGRNYGWPNVEGIGPTNGGAYTNPLVTWPTSEASPSGAAIAGSTMYLGALQGQDVLRVRLHGTSATKGTPLLSGRYGRIRTVVTAPDGSLWITTSNRDGRGSPRSGDDRIIRIQPR